MKQAIKQFIKNVMPHETSVVNRILVSTFAALNRLIITDDFSEKYIISENNHPSELPLFSQFYSIVAANYKRFEIEDLIEFFELVISPAEKEVNGAVYTPLYIREFIVRTTLSTFSNEDLLNLKIGDLSCGCGGFFITAALYIHQKTNTPINDIILNFYGVDIAAYSIERTQIILNLLCLIHGEDIINQPNLFQANSLEFDIRSVDEIGYNNGLDVIIGNPPYVSSSKISEESKLLLGKWSVASTGKTDLYLPFFQIAIEALKPDGILGYITVNNFYRSLNGRAFRAYMSEHCYKLKMVDFGSEQVFRGRSTYTCICLISRSEGSIEYCKKKSHDLDKISLSDFIRIEYPNLDDFLGWTLCDAVTTKNIKIIESIGNPLGKLFDIKNGFATLKNEVYLLTPIRETKKYFIIKDDGVERRIEKSICRKAIKPNILKEDADIDKELEYIIFPYRISTDNRVILIDEDRMRIDFPYALDYLKQKFKVLKKRDKESRTYASWYAFGRTQALNIVGKKLLFPYLADKPYFVLSEDETLLFYNGYAIVSDSSRKLKVLRRILQSSVFWYYIKHTSKPYGGNYFALAKNYVKNFGIPKLSKTEEDIILSLKEEDLNFYIENLYGVNLNN